MAFWPSFPTHPQPTSTTSSVYPEALLVSTQSSLRPDLDLYLQPRPGSLFPLFSGQPHSVFQPGWASLHSSHILRLLPPGHLAAPLLAWAVSASSPVRYILTPRSACQPLFFHGTWSCCSGQCYLLRYRSSTAPLSKEAISGSAKGSGLEVETRLQI